MGYEVVERSKKGTGFDYWLAERNSSGLLFQGLARLEVSGVLSGTSSDLSRRVSQKKKQTEVSDGLLPAIIVVVEFGKPCATLVQR
jgi:hypothetical protein